MDLHEDSDHLWGQLSYYLNPDWDRNFDRLCQLFGEEAALKELMNRTSDGRVDSIIAGHLLLRSSIGQRFLELTWHDNPDEALGIILETAVGGFNVYGSFQEKAIFWISERAENIPEKSVRNVIISLEQYLLVNEDTPYRSSMETILGKLSGDERLDEKKPLTEINTRSRIFISYSHKDEKWLERLHTFLRPVERYYQLTIWDDTKLQPGARWREEIKDALASTKVAVLLVSANFLDSDFIAIQELPPLLKAPKILWVAVSSCLYQLTPIADFQAVNDPAIPLDTLAVPKRKQALAAIATAIWSAAEEGNNDNL